jgi:hypothetical protein
MQAFFRDTGIGAGLCTLMARRPVLYVKLSGMIFPFFCENTLDKRGLRRYDAIILFHVRQI